MFQPQDSNLKKFLKSPHHLWLLALTVGLGFISAHPILLIVGVALYAVGWIHLPDSAMFRGWAARKEAEIAAAKSQVDFQTFMERRQSLIGSLTPERLRRYHDLERVCLDIEKATRDTGAAADTNADPRLRKLDELMWTFLRLLVMEASLKSFLDTETGEKIDGEIATARVQISGLGEELKAATAKGENTTARIRLLDSKKERLAVLTKRQERVNEANERVTLVAAEQDRLVEQIKLLRADAIAARNPDTLTARIDATVENLTATNKLFSEMDQFKDLVADDLPQTSERLGYSTIAAPPVIDHNYPNGRERRPGQRIHE